MECWNVGKKGMIEYWEKTTIEKKEMMKEGNNRRTGMERKQKRGFRFTKPSIPVFEYSNKYTEEVDAWEK
jgi:hypothetical protein